jgi:undecaprenyl phosphate-alpha-L-ara4FN deformylase
MKLGLRIDVDTFRGTRLGVPRLLELLGERGISASFFFTVGPDNMGRHLWRLVRPTFFVKMLRSKAASLYGLSILFKGTLWPGPAIGRKLGDVFREADRAGHEIGYHAFDHHAWQMKIDRMDSAAIRASLELGIGTLADILGRAPDCSATAGWKTNDAVLIEKDRFEFRYHSDCRGRSIFVPCVGERVLEVPQVPVTLPTFDEAVGRDGITIENFNAHLFERIEDGRLNVLTIHAEAEGISLAPVFAEFLDTARARGIQVVPLGELLPEPSELSTAFIRPEDFPGREGWIACQSEGSEENQ